MKKSPGKRILKTRSKAGLKEKNVRNNTSRISAVRKVFLPKFLISDTAGLILEVTRTKTLGAAFGKTIFAVSTVLTIFMPDLAVNTWLFGQLVIFWDQWSEYVHLEH